MALTIYGVALNDRLERDQLSEAFSQPPYKAPPRAPVLYIKPEACRAAAGSAVVVPAAVERLDVSPTLAFFFPGPPGLIGGVALAMDVSAPQRDYYRPAVRQQARDGFLPLGPFQPWRPGEALPEVTAELNGAPAQGWRPDRLVRGVDALLSDVGAFMSLSDGDILLAGSQVAPVAVRPGDRLELRAAGHPALVASFVAEDLA